MKKNNKRKMIGITLGDPAGIGPEITAKALSRKLPSDASFVIIGDYSVYAKYCRKQPAACSFDDVNCLGGKNCKEGKPTLKNAQAAMRYLQTAVALIKEKKIDALVTAPVCKESLRQVDKKFVGHTEFLRDSFGLKKVGMLFVADRLKTIVVTRHIPLNEVSRNLSVSGILSTIEMTHKAFQAHFKIKKPKIAVCGLNPHAGEGGKIGKEELRIIIPAIKKAAQKGIKVSGPFAADTLFSPTTGQNFDVVVAMYHDQGLIAAKTLCFTKLVNMTLGLPFVRTSPAHGTAFNIAGKNTADPSSMYQSILLAAQLA